MSLYLFLRVLKRGSDSRFDETKHKPGRFFFFWMAQATWVTTCLLPVITVNAVRASAFGQLAEVRATDAIGFGLFVFGWAYECIADYQKASWLDEKMKKIHDEEFITRGLFSRR